MEYTSTYQQHMGKQTSRGAYTIQYNTDSDCHMLVNMSAGQTLELYPVIYKIHMSTYLLSICNKSFVFRRQKC